MPKVLGPKRPLLADRAPRSIPLDGWYEQTRKSIELAEQRIVVGRSTVVMSCIHGSVSLAGRSSWHGILEHARAGAARGGAQVVGVEGGSEVDGETTCVNSLWASSYRHHDVVDVAGIDSFECDRVH